MTCLDTANVLRHESTSSKQLTKTFIEMKFVRIAILLSYTKHKIRFQVRLRT